MYIYIEIKNSLIINKESSLLFLQEKILKNNFILNYKCIINKMLVFKYISKIFIILFEIFNMYTRLLMNNLLFKESLNNFVKFHLG